jgi:hypothetical protein
MQSKHALQSTTIQGILVMLLSGLIPLFTDMNMAEAQEQTQHLIEAVATTLTVVGAIWAARGRKDAVKPINFFSGTSKPDEVPKPTTPIDPKPVSQALKPSTVSTPTQGT